MESGDDASRHVDLGQRLCRDACGVEDGQRTEGFTEVIRVFASAALEWGSDLSFEVLVGEVEDAFGNMTMQVASQAFLDEGSPVEWYHQ